MIIPTFNRAALIGRAIQSVFGQTLGDFELLIIDDASTDQTAERIEPLLDERTHFFRRDSNGGQNAALNDGLVLAKGKYVAFLDSDDEWLPTFLEKTVGVLESDPTLVAAYSWAGVGVADNLQPAVPFSLAGDIYVRALAQGYVSHMITLVVKRDVLSLSGHFDEAFTSCQDDDFCLRVARQGKFGLVREPLALIHQTDGQVSHNPQAYADGWWKLFHKFRQEILRLCGRRVFSAHMVKCFRYRLLARDYSGAVWAALLAVYYAPQKSVELWRTFWSLRLGRP